jgi:hypothetical protein
LLLFDRRENEHMYILINGTRYNAIAYVVIGQHVCVEVSKDTPKAFYHCGAWYVMEKDTRPA